jgi:hypothetical protein
MSLPKTPRRSVFIALIRCATERSLPTHSPSIWWKVCSCDASTASLRNTLPGTIARNGGFRRCIARTWPGDVCVRITWRGAFGLVAIQNVSIVSRAG